jgi:hypothetical protein
MNDLDRAWDRKELYEKVWLQPLRTLAVEYGISDVALGKICRKLQMPVPGPGHWTKIQCGHQIPRPPFPAGKDLPILLRPTVEPKTPLLAEDLAKLEVIHRILDPVRSPSNAAAQSRRQAALQGRLAVVWLGGSAIVC